MYKKSFYLTAFVCAAMFAGCSSGPTRVDSTRHQHEGAPTNSHGTTSHDSASHGETTHGTTNSSETSHSEMKSAPDAANQPFDLQFLDTMIAHHDGAIQMAKAATTKSTNPELKAFADKIVADQQRETIEMKKWREQWYENKPSALNMAMAGMTDSMKGMDMTKLNAATGDAYNIEFINQMIPHHEGALAMAKEAAAKAEHAELKTLANQIIKELQDYRDYWFELFKNSLPNTILFWGTAVGFLLLLAYLSRNSANTFLLFLFGTVLMSFYGYLAYVGMGRRHLRNLSEEERWTTVVFNIENDGFEWTSGKNYSYISWSSIESVIETRKYFALKRQIHTYLLTKDMFRNQAQISFFRFLLENKLGNKVKLLN